MCPYCDFAKWPLRRSTAREYLTSLLAEIEAAPAFAAQTLFIGGGTPNTYEPNAVGELVARLASRFAPGGFAEATIEMNPDESLCAGAVFDAYRAAGIDRISFGVQSFVSEELATLGRRHTATDVERAVGRARGAGFDNISLDLMFGTPRQTVESWHASLVAALALEPEHVSTYGLTVEEGTPYARWYASRPEDFAPNDLEAELYGLAIDTLAQAGFEQYEISNFSRPGRRCRHNANYWQSGEYLGLGVGAASFVDGVRSVHGRDLEAYTGAARSGRPIPGDNERLAGAARLGEAAMLLLRTAEGVDVANFAKRYGVDFHDYYRPVLEALSPTETLDVSAARVALTRRGRFVANDVCGAFVRFAG